MICREELGMANAPEAGDGVVAAATGVAGLGTEPRGGGVELGGDKQRAEPAAIPLPCRVLISAVLAGQLLCLGCILSPPPGLQLLQGRTMLIPRPCSAPASLHEGEDGDRPQAVPKAILAIPG